MLSLQELRSSKINPEIAREAYEQAEMRLTDMLETKKSFEQKALALFGAYTTGSLALVGVAGSVFKDDDTSRMQMALVSSALVLLAGAVLFVVALRERTYGALGSNPEMWLCRNTLDGPDAALPLMLAYITFHHQERIKASIAGNDSMARLIRWGIYTGVFAPFVAAAVLFTPLGTCLQAFL
jgi:hypothetical protein